MWLPVVAKAAKIALPYIGKAALIALPHVIDAVFTHKKKTVVVHHSSKLRKRFGK